MFGSNPQPHLLLLALVLVLGQFSSSAQSLMFELQSGHTRCIAEDIKRNEMTVGKYNITNPNEGHPLPDSHRVTVRVTSPNGNYYHIGEGVEAGHFSFVAVEAGDYIICFRATNHNPQITLTIEFDWRAAVTTNVWSNIAKKSKVDIMVLLLKDLQETVSSIHEEMFYLRSRQEEGEELNWETNNKMFWSSFLSLFVCLSVVGLQLWHLKSFFEKKKLI